MVAHMEVRDIPVEQLRAAEYNPRVSLRKGDPEYEKLKKSVQTLGVIDPLVWNEATGTLIACEQLARKCYGMELDPRFCDVIVDRWEKLTGKEAGRHGDDRAPI